MQIDPASFAKRHEEKLHTILHTAALQAGTRILEIYDRPISMEVKEDGSPVTQADQAAEKIILHILNEHFPTIGTMAEESHANGEVQHIGETFFCVDPLDGTKEFIKKWRIYCQYRLN